MSTIYPHFYAAANKRLTEAHAKLAAVVASTRPRE